MKLRFIFRHKFRPFGSGRIRSFRGHDTHSHGYESLTSPRRMILQEKLRGKIRKTSPPRILFSGGGSEDVEKLCRFFGGLEGVEKDQVVGWHFVDEKL